MKHITKHIAALVAVLMFFALLLPAAAADSATVLTGTFGAEGDNLTWTLKNGTLTISGSGEMEDFTEQLPPWVEEIFKYYEAKEGLPAWSVQEAEEEHNISETYPLVYLRIGMNTTTSRPLNVVIEEGVENVGANAFSLNCVHSLSLPSTLRRIGDHAFVAIAGDSVILPEGLEEIGDGALGFGYHLDRLTIPSTVTSLGDGAINASGVKDLYVLNPELDLTDAIELTVSNENFPFTDAAEFNDFLMVEFAYEVLVDVFDRNLHMDDHAQAIMSIYPALTRAEAEEYVRYAILEIASWVLKPTDLDSVVTPDSALAAVLAVVNDELGTDFTAPEDVVANLGYIPESQHLYHYDYQMTEAMREAVVDRFGEAGLTAFTYTHTYLGVDPQTASYTSMTAYNCDEPDLSGTLTFLPFYTVHGAAGSTAEAAAAASGIPFEVHAHTFGEWAVTKEATVTEAGEKQRACTACGFTEKGEIPPVGVPAPEEPGETSSQASGLRALLERLAEFFQRIAEFFRNLFN